MLDDPKAKQNLALLDPGSAVGTQISLLDSAPTSQASSLAGWIEDRISKLRDQPSAEQRKLVLSWWRELDRDSVLILSKLMTGGFRVGVSEGIVERALAEAAGVSKAVISHRLMGEWKVGNEFFKALLSAKDQVYEPSRPYPFYLASLIEETKSKSVQEILGQVTDYQIEWKWDGIRAQLMRRGPEIFLWSRGEELITERFPEIKKAALNLPDRCVIDEELLAYKNSSPLPFSRLQTRIGRVKLNSEVLEQAPVALMVYDLLEENGIDLRARPLEEGREKLEDMVATRPDIFPLSPIIHSISWNELETLRAESRKRNVERLMIKRKSSPYEAGRKRGNWWKWKISPYTVDAVLLYAQPGHGRRSNLYTDYTLGCGTRKT